MRYEKQTEKKTEKNKCAPNDMLPSIWIRVGGRSSHAPPNSRWKTRPNRKKSTCGNLSTIMSREIQQNKNKSNHAPLWSTCSSIIPGTLAPYSYSFVRLCFILSREFAEFVCRPRTKKRIGIRNNTEKRRKKKKLPEGMPFVQATQKKNMKEKDNLILCR